MAPTPAQLQAYLPIKVGDTTGIVAQQVALIWDMYADRKPLELQYNYALVECIELLIGKNWKSTNWSGDGRSVSASDKIKVGLTLMAQRADARIQELIKGRSIIGVTVGKLTTTNIIPSPALPLGPDANNPQYGGDPNTPWPVGRDLGSGWW